MSRLRHQALRWTSGSRDDANDLLQDAAERALRTAHGLAPDSNATAWMRVIMHHLVIDGARRRQRDRKIALELVHQAEESVPELPVLEPTPLPEMNHVRQAAPRLREPLRSTFRLWALERNGYLAISRIQNIPVGTVATRLMRARRQVRALVEGESSRGQRAEKYSSRTITPVGARLVAETVAR